MAPLASARAKSDNAHLPVVQEEVSAQAANLQGLNDALRLTTEQRQEFQAKMQETMLHVVRDIMSKTEDVGESFPEEARKIHYQEAPERSIRGVATPDQAAELIEEGIEVFSLPVTTGLKNTLQ